MCLYGLCDCNLQCARMQVSLGILRVSSIAQVHHRMLINVMGLDHFSGLSEEWSPGSSIFIRFYKGLVSVFSNGAKHCFPMVLLAFLATPWTATCQHPVLFLSNDLYILSTTLGLRYMGKWSLKDPFRGNLSFRRIHFFHDFLSGSRGTRNE